MIEKINVNLSARCPNLFGREIWQNLATRYQRPDNMKLNPTELYDWNSKVGEVQYSKFGSKFLTSRLHVCIEVEMYIS